MAREAEKAAPGNPPSRSLRTTGPFPFSYVEDMAAFDAAMVEEGPNIPWE